MEALLTFSSVAFCSKTVRRVAGEQSTRERKQKKSEFVLYTRRMNSFKEVHTFVSYRTSEKGAQIVKEGIRQCFYTTIKDLVPLNLLRITLLNLPV